jgi:hypothetical protein
MLGGLEVLTPRDDGDDPKDVSLDIIPDRETAIKTSRSRTIVAFRDSSS